VQEDHNVIYTPYIMNSVLNLMIGFARIFLLLVLISQTCSARHSRRKSFLKRQAITCEFGGTEYQLNENWHFSAGSKTFYCTCTKSGNPSCDWTSTSEKTQCYDRDTRKYHAQGSLFTKLTEGGLTLDCTCSRNGEALVTECSSRDRCHSNGVSHRTGDKWKSMDDVTGVELNCKCLGKERINCTASVTRTLGQASTNTQWVEDHVVRNNVVIRPAIATLQACDTGSRVVSSGYRWNRTIVVAERTFEIDKCVCRDALISCDRQIITRSSEPHCISEQGVVKSVGEQWVKVHETHDNLRWDCTCVGHARANCIDAGTCADPIAPPNGALICATTGLYHDSLKTYCMPMCSYGYEFVRDKRYYLSFEECSKSTYHMWTGGYVENPLWLAKCAVPNRNQNASVSRRRKDKFTLPTLCNDLDTRQINQLKSKFVKKLQRQNLCIKSQCRVKWLRCGEIR